MKRLLFAALLFVSAASAHATNYGSWTCVKFGDGKCITNDYNAGYISQNQKMASASDVGSFIYTVVSPIAKPGIYAVGDSITVCDLARCIDLAWAGGYWQVTRAAYDNVAGAHNFINATSSAGSKTLRSSVSPSTYNLTVDGYWKDQDWYWDGEYIGTRSYWVTTGIFVVWVNGEPPGDAGTVSSIGGSGSKD